MKKAYGYIYKITHIPTGRYYIGLHKGCSPETDGYMGSGTVWKKILLNHPEIEFKKEVLCTASTKKELEEKEKFFVSDLFASDHLCKNCVPGGGVPPVVQLQSNEAKKKRLAGIRSYWDSDRSVSHRKNLSKKMKGVKLSEETREKISAAHRGIKPTDDTRKKMSESAKSRPKRRLSETHKKKISEAIKVWHNRSKGANG